MTRTNEVKRAALKAEWEIGRSNRDLARRYGVSEGIIRHWAKGENWQRDEKASETIHTRAQMLTRAHLANPKASRGTTARCGETMHPMTHATHLAEPAETARAQRPEPIASVSAGGAQETIRELSMEMVAQALAQAQIAQLDRAADLTRVFDRLAGLLEVALVPVDADADPEAAREQSLALTTLLAGGNSSNLSSILLVWTKMAESIQTQERRALGVEDRPKRVAMPAGQGEPVQTASAPKIKKPDVKIDFSKLSPDEIKAVQVAVALLGGHQERRPPVVPTTNPSETQTNWTRPTEVDPGAPLAKH